MSTYGVDLTATTAAASADFIAALRKVSVLIDTPAFIQIDMLNGTRISGKYVSYSDPMRADAHGAFRAEGSDGVQTYVLWCGILRITVFPLDAVAPEATPLEKPEA